MEPNNLVNFQCLLCKEFLNGKLDNNFTEHMEYHNIKFNQEFIFSTFFLSHKGIEKTVEFMLNYSESEALAENSSGTTKNSATEFVADITTEEELIVPDTPKARDSTKEVITDNSAPKDSQGTPDGEVKEEDLVSDQTKDEDEDLVEIDDEDLIETWNLWNEDEIRRATSTRPNENISNDVTEDDDDPDYQWESVTSRRTISRSSKVKASSDKERICHCDMEFPDEAAKTRHMVRFHNKFKCPECPLTFASSTSLRYHMQHSKRKHDPDYGKTQCSICGAHFKSYKFLRDHRTAIHKIGDKKSCPYCGEKIHDVRKHIRVAHNVVKECEICGKKVKNLETHFKTIHGGDENRKFRCATCNKGFVLKEKLIAHQLVHSDERPFKCKFGCGFGAKTLGNCKKHEESKHNQKRVYVNGKPLPKMSNTNNNAPKRQARSNHTTVYKSRFREVKDEILSEVVVKSEEEVLDVIVEVCPMGQTCPTIGIISSSPQSKELVPTVKIETMASGDQIVLIKPSNIPDASAGVIEPTLDMEVDDVEDYEPVSRL